MGTVDLDGVEPSILGPADRIAELTVIWPGATEGRTYRDLPADVTFLIEEGADAPIALEPWVSSSQITRELPPS